MMPSTSYPIRYRRQRHPSKTSGWSNLRELTCCRHRPLESGYVPGPLRNVDRSRIGPGNRDRVRGLRQTEGLRRITALIQNRIEASAARHRVGTVANHEDVVAVVAVVGIGAGTSHQRIVAASTVEYSVRRQEVVPRIAVQRNCDNAFDSGHGFDGVVAVVSVDSESVIGRQPRRSN